MGSRMVGSVTILFTVPRPIKNVGYTAGALFLGSAIVISVAMLLDRKSNTLSSLKIRPIVVGAVVTCTGIITGHYGVKKIAPGDEATIGITLVFALAVGLAVGIRRATPTEGGDLWDLDDRIWRRPLGYVRSVRRAVQPASRSSPVHEHRPVVRRRAAGGLRRSGAGGGRGRRSPRWRPVRGGRRDPRMTAVPWETLIPVVV